MRRPRALLARRHSKWTRNRNYFPSGVLGLDTKLQPDASVPKEDRFNDVGVDATYPFTDGGRNGLFPRIYR